MGIGSWLKSRNLHFKDLDPKKIENMISYKRGMSLIFRIVGFVLFVATALILLFVYDLVFTITDPSTRLSVVMGVFVVLVLFGFIMSMEFKMTSEHRKLDSHIIELLEYIKSKVEGDEEK